MAEGDRREATRPAGPARAPVGAKKFLGFRGFPHFFQKKVGVSPIFITKILTFLSQNMGTPIFFFRGDFEGFGGEFCGIVQFMRDFLYNRGRKIEGILG